MRKTRSPERAERDEAAQIYRQLLASRGADRSPRADAAIRAIGGWQRIELREDREAQRIEREFCQAYAEAGA